MKDALGHGSNAHGARVEDIGQSFLSVVKGNGRDKNYYVQHGPTKTWLGSTLMFKSQKAGESFMRTHLDPTNPFWRDAPNLMTAQYTKAATEFRKSRK